MEVVDTSTGSIDSPLKKYELVELLGEGGSGITYRAIRLADQTSVAIKVLSLRHLQDWKQLELFEREAQVLSQICHPQIPQYLEYFHVDTPDNRAFYIVQQLAPGKPLTEWVQSGWRGTEAEIKDIARQLLEILQYLHQQSPPLIHRDIKPHNIIRSDDGQVFLVDFGAVQNVYQNTLLKGSTVAGTYGYMSPEQFRGSAVPASDLYGLGATVLYLLTHRSPADLPQERLKLKFRDHVNISELFAGWLEMMLEPNIVDRFSTAEQASIALSKKHTFRLGHRKQTKLSGKTKLIFAALLMTLFSIYQYRYALLIKAGIQPNNFCAEDMDIAIIDDYLNHGGDANIKVDTPLNWAADGLTDHDQHLLLLNCAIKFNKIEIVETLLNHGADPNLLDTDTVTSLHDAILGDTKIVQLLLERGANPNLADKNGNTPLHCLVTIGDCRHPENFHPDLFKLFIKYKAAPHLANKDGNTVLHLVARQNLVGLYDYLVKSGWNPLQKNNKGETAQQLIN
jgi:serine/threonine protein kinase